MSELPMPTNGILVEPFELSVVGNTFSWTDIPGSQFQPSLLPQPGGAFRTTLRILCDGIPFRQGFRATRRVQLIPYSNHRGDYQMHVRLLVRTKRRIGILLSNPLHESRREFASAKSGWSVNLGDCRNVGRRSR